MRCGKLCKSCGGSCLDAPTKTEPVEIACPECREAGCDACGGLGYFLLDDCPKRYVGWEMTEAANLAGLAIQGMLPIAGGVLDQSAWFVDMWTTLAGDQNRIDAEDMERMRHG